MNVTLSLVVAIVCMAVIYAFSYLFTSDYRLSLEITAGLSIFYACYGTNLNAYKISQYRKQYPLKEDEK